MTAFDAQLGGTILAAMAAGAAAFAHCLGMCGAREGRQQGVLGRQHTAAPDPPDEGVAAACPRAEKQTLM
jgi:hypothetical protein